MLTGTDQEIFPGGGGYDGYLSLPGTGGGGLSWGIFLLILLCKFKQFCFNSAGEGSVPTSVPTLYMPSLILSRSAHG